MAPAEAVHGVWSHGGANATPGNSRSSARAAAERWDTPPTGGAKDGWGKLPNNVAACTVRGGAIADGAEAHSNMQYGMMDGRFGPVATPGFPSSRCARQCTMQSQNKPVHNHGDNLLAHWQMRGAEAQVASSACGASALAAKARSRNGHRRILQPNGYGGLRDRVAEYGSAASLGYAKALEQAALLAAYGAQPAMGMVHMGAAMQVSVPVAAPASTVQMSTARSRSGGRSSEPCNPAVEQRCQQPRPQTPVPVPLAMQAAPPPVVVWDCRHPHGLFSMFSLALGLAEHLLIQGWGLYVDWSHHSLLYKGPPNEPNLWNALFRQPAEVAGFASSEDLAEAVFNQRFHTVKATEFVFGEYRGVLESSGQIPPGLARRGRTLCRRIIRMSQPVAHRLATLGEMLLGGGRRWLAVHVRRTDKVCEAASNLQLTDEDILQAIMRQCNRHATTGVFLCSDDSALKERIAARIPDLPGPQGTTLAVSTYKAALSNSPGQAAHFDTSVDAYQKAEDVVMEAFLMARGCHALLSTFSNVSASVVYLSPDRYPFATFWDE
mmetsp:Transcript_72882/g.202177  ORF Transcript_72882/g.202177 Transcript_72882/m.202177 type:complete len:550 (+) Transcript_72882:81-1730(+)